MPTFFMPAETSAHCVIHRDIVAWSEREVSLILIVGRANLAT